MTTVSQLLEAKHDPIVHTIGEGRTALDAAHLMNEHRIGALIVNDTLGRTAGIITERDILTRVVSAQLDPSTTPVSRVMTTEIVYCTPRTSMEEARQIMTDRKIRHIPIVAEGGGSLLGMISIGDLNAAANANLSFEVESMRQYIIAG